MFIDTTDYTYFIFFTISYPESTPLTGAGDVWFVTPDLADTNCDGTIDIVDALLITQYYVGLITRFY